MADNQPVDKPLTKGYLNDKFEGNTWQDFQRRLQDYVNRQPGQSNGNVLVANLPMATYEGSTMFATDGRKVGEGAGSGTGVPVYFSQGVWRVFSTDAAVTT